MKKRNLTYTRLHEKIDKNKDNFISKAELRDFFTKDLEINMSLDEMNIFLSYCDKNNDDKISVPEFIKGL